MGPSSERRLPRRTCVSCGRTGDKATFLRIAGRPGGTWRIDPAVRRPGRGLYLCREEGCIRRFTRRLHTRKGGDRWRMGKEAEGLAEQLESWWSSGAE